MLTFTFTNFTFMRVSRNRENVLYGTLEYTQVPQLGGQGRGIGVTVVAYCTNVVILASVIVVE